MYNFESTTFKRLTNEYYYDKLIKGRSFFLFGPRQTGKSTLLESIFDRLPAQRQLRVYLQLSATRQALELDPETLLRQVEARRSDQPLFLFIDEIQKVPQILDMLQFLLDKKKVILAASGSSARKMRHLGSNWLPGRVELEWLDPLSWQESGITKSQILFERALLYGTLPGLFAIADDETRMQRLEQYTQLYLEEEIRAEAQIRNLPKFSKFLQLAALESGTAPNFSKLAHEVGVTHTTIANYYQLLEDTLIVHRVDAYGNARSQVIRSPRYFFFDLGVRNSAARIGHSAGLLNLQKGILFEHCLILELIATLRKSMTFHYWRHKKGYEVDMILLPKIGLPKPKPIAIEIKATQKPSLKDFEGLEVFSEQYPCAATYLVCQIKEQQQFGQHLAIPWQVFGETLSDHRAACVDS